MNKHILRFGIVILFTILLAGCDKFDRTEVAPEIYVNKSAINGFIGEEVQLTASPTEGSYSFGWSSEDPAIATVTSSGLVKLIGEGSTAIVLSAGNIRQRVVITSLKRIPLSEVTLSETLIELIPQTVKKIAVQIFPANANDVPNAVWATENDKVATVNEEGNITAIGEGNTNVSYKIGTIVRTVKVVVSFTRPFNRSHILQAGQSLLVMAADFDFGGPGRAFQDEAGNNVGNDNYRRGKGDTNSGDVEVEGDGDNIGYTSSGEWYQYTIAVKEAGTYKLEVSLSAAGASKYHVEVDNVNVTGSIGLASNGSWSSWIFHRPITLNLTEGNRKIKFVVEEANFNLRALRFTKE